MSQAMHFIATLAGMFKGKTARAEILRTSPADGWVYRGKRLVVKLADLQNIFNNWKAYPRDIPLDYEHGSAAADAKPGAGIAAGWLRDLELSTNGESATLTGVFELTDRAAEWVSKGEYRLTSAEFNTDFVHPEAGKPIGMTLLAVALTNRPFVTGLAPMTMLSEAAAQFMQTEQGTTEQPSTRIFADGLYPYTR